MAQENWRAAGVAERVEVLIGPAASTLDALIAAGTDPYDLVFIDADKKNNPTYLEAALALTRPGSVIVIDNVIRGGRIVGDSDDPDVVGTRRALEMLGSDPRLQATAVQTVSSKGWDGFGGGVRAGLRLNSYSVRPVPLRRDRQAEDREADAGEHHGDHRHRGGAAAR